MTKREQPEFQTARLHLRPFRLADGPRVQMLAGDRAIADTTLNIPHPYEEGMAEEWIATHQAGFEAGESITCALVLRDEEALVGAAGLTVSARFNRAELGYWIGRPYWGRGYATEAARAMLEYGFREMDLHKIIARHLARNPASGRVMEKLGMTLEGTLREDVRKWDRYEDVRRFGILKREWEAGSPSGQPQAR